MLGSFVVVTFACKTKIHSEFLQVEVVKFVGQVGVRLDNAPADSAAHRSLFVPKLIATKLWVKALNSTYSEHKAAYCQYNTHYPFVQTTSRQHGVLSEVAVTRRIVQNASITPLIHARSAHRTTNCSSARLAFTGS